jgi:type IV fimbrial biogenesis protein FimT
MLMFRQRSAGLTLVELMISLVVFSILIAAGVPSFSAWIQNTRIRTAGEGILNGLQFARTEAVRRNTNVEFSLSGTGAGWSVQIPNVAPALQTRDDTEGGTTVALSPQTAGGLATTKATFNGMGWIVDNDDGTPHIDQVGVTSSTVTGSEIRSLRVSIGTGGSVKMCDPAVSAGDPRACS